MLVQDGLPEIRAFGAQLRDAGFEIIGHLGEGGTAQVFK